MLSGKRFKLREPVIGKITDRTDKTVVQIVPTFSVVEIISGSLSGLRTLDVLWGGRVLTMFASDLDERGDELLHKQVALSSEP